MIVGRTMFSRWTPEDQPAEQYTSPERRTHLDDPALPFRTRLLGFGAYTRFRQTLQRTKDTCKIAFIGLQPEKEVKSGETIHDSTPFFF